MSVWFFIGILGGLGVLGGIALLCVTDGTDGVITGDQFTAERQHRLQQMQPDVDIARRDQPRRPITRRDIEARRASSYLTRGF